MSLTNPNTPVSQQDLKDLYEQKILPYIGGAFGLVATGINSSNLYSTTERVIGQWIDGKPLYQKTVNFGSLSNKDDKVIEHGIANIDRIVHAHALAFNPTTGSGKPLSFAYDNGGSGLAAQIGFNVSRTYIEIFNRGDNYSAFNAYATIQYTKTTDSAVESYGTDTTYSTDEHVVGSWIDGRPVYQKTIYRDTPITITTSDSEYATITGIGSLVDFRLIRANSTGVPWESLSGINASVIIASSSLRVRSVVSNYSDTVNKSYAILQYTKTS